MRLRPSAILGFDLSHVHRVPIEFGSLFHFRRWLCNHTIIIKESMEGSKIVKSNSWGLGFIMRNGEYISVASIGKEVVHKILDRGIPIGRNCSRRWPDPTHIAAFHVTLRSIDAYHQYGGVCRRCGHTSFLPSR